MSSSTHQTRISHINIDGILAYRTVCDTCGWDDQTFQRSVADELVRIHLDQTAPRKIEVTHHPDAWAGETAEIVLHLNDFQSTAWNLTPAEALVLAEQLTRYAADHA